MKYANLSPLSRPRLFAAALALAAAGTILAAGAAQIDISETPLASSSSGLVKPNVFFVLDTSGSMAWTHAPDDVSNWYGKVGYVSSHCNSIYYDPNIKYLAPKNADGTNFADQSFGSALYDGYDSTQGSVNLGLSFQAYDANTTKFAGGVSDKQQPAYYFTYTGTVTQQDFVNTSSQFYTECSLPATDSATATLTITGGSFRQTTTVNGITVNGVQVMGGTASSTSNSGLASSIASNVNKNSYTATSGKDSSGNSIVVITAPDSTVVGVTPSVSISKGNMKIAAAAFVAPPFKKVLVSTTSGPGGTDETQNFANWYSYYRTRILMMKSGAGRAFSAIGDTYRVGFMNIYVTSPDSDPNFLAIHSFDSTQKPKWFSELYSQNPGGSTPLRIALSHAGQYYAHKFGSDDPIQYSCQQNFTILTTDGYWNESSTPLQVDLKTAIGDQDGTLATPFKDASSTPNSLSDVAEYYYATDLRDAAAPQSNATGALGTDVSENNVPVSGSDNAPWQHMTTFTLGLGVNGQLNYSSDYLTGGSADYNAIVSGSLNWPTPVSNTRTTVDDLWHAAVNGRGQYFSAKNPDLLVSGLSTALAGVSTREAAGAAAATSNLEPVAGDNSAFVANYRTVKWDGDVQSRSIDLSTGAISSTPNWSAQLQLDTAVSATLDNRTIYTYLAGAMVPFLPTSFTSAQKAAWFTPGNSPVLTQFSGWTAAQSTAATPDTVINYLRGQNGFEERGSNAVQLYRMREHVLGDIINGKPVYVKVPPFNYSENNYQSFKTSLSTRQGVVYVAANDGMLHAFNSDTGVEMWAYIPSFVLPNLKALADDNYANAHQFYVDGSPTVSDVWTGSAWRTILVGGLNAGGKGYYALDVTNPATPKVLWEFSDANLGYTYGNPIIGKLTSGQWVVVFTSGYNNADGVGRLYVLDANTGAVQFTISTNTGDSTTPSGLGKISAWVDDGLNDNTIQRVYGGDMLGNLWRFDVNDIIPPSGKDAFLLAQLKVGSPAYYQPITTKPELGLIKTTPMVFVGTGRYLGASDLSDLNQQSLYAMRDDLSATSYGDIRSNGCLVQQTLKIIDANTRSTSTNPVDLGTSCGWYVDFNPQNASPGERVNVDPKLQLGVLAVATNIPEKSVCTVGGSSFLYFFDYTTGQFVSTMTGQVAGQRIGNAIAVGLNTYRLPDGRVVTTVTTSDDKHPVFGNPDNPLAGSIGKRVLWRELLN